MEFIESFDVMLWGCSVALPISSWFIIFGEVK